MAEKIIATLIGEKIASNSAEAHSLFTTHRFGEKTGEKTFYTLSETYFLIEEGKLELQNFQGKKVSKTDALKKFQNIDKKFKIKYLVFKDLRKKGYIVKTALKFGAEFRIYEKGKSIGKDHAKWILFPVSENEKFSWQDFSAKNRVAHSVKKNLLIAIVDEENDISYYEVGWKKI